MRSMYVIITDKLSQGVVTPIGTVSRAATQSKSSQTVKAHSRSRSNGQAVFWPLLMVIKRHGWALTYAQFVLGQQVKGKIYHGQAIKAIYNG